MKTLIGALALLALSSCSHYFPIQLKSGKPISMQFQSCSHNIFSFPTNSEGLRIDKSMKKNNIEADEVYSVETKFWPYFWPIYSQQCTIITLNDNFELKTSSATEDEASEIPFGHLNNITQCRRYTRTTRLKCRKYFNEK